MSFPSRERGLKYHYAGAAAAGDRVVPFAGTWIEIAVIFIGIWHSLGRSLRGNVD